MNKLKLTAGLLLILVAVATATFALPGLWAAIAGADPGDTYWQSVRYMLLSFGALGAFAAFVFGAVQASEAAGEH